MNSYTTRKKTYDEHWASFHTSICWFIGLFLSWYFKWDIIVLVIWFGYWIIYDLFNFVKKMPVDGGLE